MKLRTVLLFLLIIGYSRLVGQSIKPEYYLTVNGNLFLPNSESHKGVYPIIGYDKKSDPKFLIGGLGVGLSYLKPLKEKIALKAQANFSRNAYWDEPVNFNMGPDPSQVLGKYSGAGANYCLGVSGLGHYYLGSKFSIGTGLGTRVLVLSVSRMPDASFYGKKGEISVNKFYKPIQPFVPIETTLKLKKMLFNIRYEWTVLNSFKHDLAQYKKDRYGLLFFEIGYKIN